MAQSFQIFVDTYNGTGHDVDGYYGAQCWDGYAFYDQWLGYSPIHCTATGGARDLWEQRNSNGILNNHDIVTGNPQNGDIGVWTNAYGGGYGHVAMYYNGQWMGQNQGGAAYPGGGAVFNIVSLSWPDGGLLRPKCYSGGSGGTKKVLELDLKNGIVIGARWVEVEI